MWITFIPYVQLKKIVPKSWNKANLESEQLNDQVFKLQKSTSRLVYTQIA